VDFLKAPGPADFPAPILQGLTGKSMERPSYCPQCGEAVPPEVDACPSCGSDFQTGWSDQAKLDRLGVPSEEFDYNAFVREEFGAGGEGLRPKGISWFWWTIAVVVLLAFLCLFVF